MIDAKWLTPDYLSAYGSLLLAVSAAVAGGWAVHNYRRARQVERAKWLKDIFVEFYIEDNFSKVRSLVEYEHDRHLAPLIEKRFYDRHIEVTPEETEVLKEFDQLLNYFEHLLYLEESKLLEKADRDALFEYWFEIFSAPEKAVIRRYCAHFGFERVAKVLKAHEMNMVALYGSLMTGCEGYRQLRLSESLKFVSPCRFSGTLYDMGDYPGLVECEPGTDCSITGELFEVIDPNIMGKLDAFERYDAQDRGGSLYIRKCIQLEDPAHEAWVYYYNVAKDELDYKSRPRIPRGDWREYRDSRAS